GRNSRRCACDHWRGDARRDGAAHVGTPMIPSSRARVRALIASRIAQRGDVGAIGEIVLEETQREAVRRARSALLRFRGVLLADDVGTGKTYIGLALIAPYENPLVIAPAALRHMWNRAARRVAAPI